MAVMRAIHNSAFLITLGASTLAGSLAAAAVIGAVLGLAAGCG